MLDSSLHTGLDLEEDQAGQLRRRSQVSEVMELPHSGSEEFLKGDIRVAKDLDGLGCLGDMGWYCIRAILWAFSWDLPHTVQAAPGASHNL